MSRDKILRRWESEIRIKIANAKNMRHPILIDTIPAYLDNLAQALTPDHPRDRASDYSTLAQEHGGERARVSPYDPDDIIQEYQILNQVIIDCLEDEVDLTRAEKLVIQHSVDGALKEAVTAFALVQASIREQFIATLTHDLRNPIGVIQMAAELAFDELHDPVVLKDLLQRIVTNAKRADGMIQDLLDTTVVKGGGRLVLEIAETNMLELVTAVVNEAKVTYGDRFKIVGEPVIGYWDRDTLRRALENLIGNAVKYGCAKREITLQIKSCQSRLLMSVHNEGNPIPVAEQEAIFQIFRRADQAKSGEKKGWGLGLPMVRGVAESHGGSLIVDSSEERGTTFMVDIPLDSRPFQDASAVN